MLRHYTEWPIQIIIDESSLIKYQLLFRHLFKCKWVHKSLSESCWKKLQRSKSFILHSSSTDLLRSAFCLCHSMSHFLQTLQSFYQQQIVLPKFRELSEVLQKTNDVEKILQAHSSYLDDLLEGFFIVQDPQLVSNLQNMLNVANLFSSFVSDVVDSLPFEKLTLISNQPASRDNKKKEVEEISFQISEMLRTHSFEEKVSKFSHNWKVLKESLQSLAEEKILKNSTRNEIILRVTLFLTQI